MMTIASTTLMPAVSLPLLDRCAASGSVVRVTVVFCLEQQTRAIRSGLVMISHVLACGARTA